MKANMETQSNEGSPVKKRKKPRKLEKRRKSFKEKVTSVILAGRLITCKRKNFLKSKISKFSICKRISFVDKESLKEAINEYIPASIIKGTVSCQINQIKNFMCEFRKLYNNSSS